MVYSVVIYTLCARDFHMHSSGDLWRAQGMGEGAEGGPQEDYWSGIVNYSELSRGNKTERKENHVGPGTLNFQRLF